MRIVVDLQGAQASNARRGIGGYSMALTQALLDEAAAHEIVVVLNGEFGDTFDEVAGRLRDRAPDVAIEVWYPPRSVRAARGDDPWDRRAAEVIREEFIASLRPDVVLLTSLFEGFVDAAVTGVGSLPSVPTAVVLYDLIPLVRRSEYLADPAMESWYEGRIGHLRRADLLLAISGATRQEAMAWLDLPGESVVEIGAGVRPIFHPGELTDRDERRVRERFGLRRPFLLYTGGIDPRKNIDGLLEAYSLLSVEVRSTSQLAIVCSVDDATRVELRRRSNELGLTADEVVLTGYVSDGDLVSLYQLCLAAVYPSVHEGFGLPALEAMACGRAVIASDRSSLPEVVGREDALFDPTSPTSIAAAMARVLGDESFRTDLARHGLERSATFSWRSTACRTLAALEALGAAAQPAASVQIRQQRPRLAFLSPLPPEESGISDYSAILLPHLAARYDIEVVTDLDQITDPWVATNCTKRTVSWFREHHRLYDRIVYNVGNSSFHGHMFALIDEIPGVIVLHDFALSGIVAHESATGRALRPWTSDLYHSHGYEALVDNGRTGDVSDIVWQYPVNLRVLQQALGVIVHSETARVLADQWYGAGSAAPWQVVPMPRSTVGAPTRAEARARLGAGDNDVLVCSFGMVGPTKLNDRLVEAWAKSSLSSDPRCRLVFVGESHESPFTTRLHHTIRDHGLGGVTITGRVDATTYATYLAAADIGVQLRCRSRGETSASSFDCLAHGLATIVNANGSLAELPSDSVYRLPDEFGDDELVGALETLRTDSEVRERLGHAGRTNVARRHTPRAAATMLADAIELIWHDPTNRRPHAVSAIGRLPGAPLHATTLPSVALSLARSVPVWPRMKQLFVDVSELNVRDAGSGIQRVTRNIVSALLGDPPIGYRVEPVAATIDSEYRMARRFTTRLLGVDAALDDDALEYARGDVFLGLDLHPQVVPSHREFFRRLRRGGVEVAFVVYDLLPLLAPDDFYPGAAEMYERWLTTAREADRLVAISRSVQQDVAEWLEAHPLPSPQPRLSWFHLGSELDGERTAERTSPGQHRNGRNGIDFLMVGTIEPRKRHRQVLDAFELLWERDHDVNLVMVGRVGWMMDDFVERVRRHPELGRRLFWIDDAPDDQLLDLYQSSGALVAASTAEGFGLPLIEAARLDLPIIARDLPVFREVAGEHATYFSGDLPTEIADVIGLWIQRRQRSELPSSADISRLTWTESARQLVDAVLDG